MVIIGATMAGVRVQLSKLVAGQGASCLAHLCESLHLSSLVFHPKLQLGILKIPKKPAMAKNLDFTIAPFSEEQRERIMYHNSHQDQHPSGSSLPFMELGSTHRTN